MLAAQVADGYGNDAGIAALWASIGVWMLARLLTLAPRAASQRWLRTGTG